MNEPQHDLPDDPFGLRGLDVERLRSKRGAKWGARRADYSAWVADMDFPVAPAIVDAHMPDHSEAERALVKGGNLARLLGWAT